MDSESPLWHVKLSAAHHPTGKTRHEVNGIEMPVPCELRISQCGADPGYYLFYCDEHGDVMTDTWHESLEAARAQATWEFNVPPNQWISGA